MNQARWESMNGFLVTLLIKAVTVVQAKNENRFHPAKELGLNFTGYNNFQKLRYHALIAHFNKENLKSGEWLLTKWAGQFLRGEIKIPRKVRILNNHIVEHSLEMIGIQELRGSPYYEATFDYEKRLQSEPPKTAPLFA